MNSKGLSNRSERLCLDLIHYFDGEGDDLSPKQKRVLKKELIDLHRILGHHLYRSKEFA